MVTDKLGQELKIGDFVFYGAGDSVNSSVQVGVIKSFGRLYSKEIDNPNLAYIFTIRGRKLGCDTRVCATRRLINIIKCPDELVQEHFEFAKYQYEEYLQTLTNKNTDNND